jgi:hypothetical protein
LATAFANFVPERTVALTRQMAALAIPTAHTRNERGGTQDHQESSVEKGLRKLKGQADLPEDEKASRNDGKHQGKSKSKINPEKPQNESEK